MLESSCKGEGVGINVNYTHNVIKLTAGKITSRDLGYNDVYFKAKDGKIIADRDFTTKSQIPEVQLTAKKEMFIGMEDMSESRREGDQWVDVG